MKFIYDFAGFILNPNLSDEFKIVSIPKGLSLIFKAYITILFIGLLVSLLIIWPLEYLNLFPQKEKIILDTRHIIKLVLLAPILEELLFRLPLKLSRRNLAISFCVILYILIGKENPILGATVSLIVFLYFIILFKQQNKFFANISSFYIKHFHFFFVLQGVVFGSLHLSKYNLDPNYFYLYPLFALNQIFVGFMLGYLRIRYSNGIIWCILTHMIVNGVYCLIFAT